MHTGLDFHAEKALIGLFDLVRLRIPIPFRVLGGTRRINQGSVQNRALAHRQDFLAKVAIKDLFTKSVLLLQGAEGDDHGLIKDSVANQLFDGNPLMVGI